MRKATLAAAVLALAAISGLSLPALAQTPRLQEPKILFHIGTPVTKNDCQPTASGSPVDTCSKVVTNAGLGNYYVYVMVVKGDSMSELAGVEFGITYDHGAAGAINDQTGLDMFGWKLCATLEFVTPLPVWNTGGAAPGAGTLITWDQTRCNRGAIATAGYFYVAAYSTARLSAIRRPVSGLAKVAACNPATEVPVRDYSLGWAQFSAGGSDPGCNPCLTLCVNSDVPVKNTTWSGVKTLYH